jgi:[ribosomal protein S5]-alanine N-acetyltransferase
MSPIETARLSIREISEADGEFIFGLMNEPAYIRYIGDRGIRTPENARAYILDKLAASYARFGFGMYLVELKGGPEAVGICGFVKRDSLEHPDIGFAFLREHWSRGFAFEASSAVLGHGFGALGLKTVLGVTLPDNRGSIRLLERLGLRFQKMIRLPRVDRDSMLFSTEGGIA